HFPLVLSTNSALCRLRSVRENLFVRALVPPIVRMTEGDKHDSIQCRWTTLEHFLGCTQRDPACLIERVTKRAGGDGRKRDAFELPLIGDSQAIPITVRKQFSIFRHTLINRANCVDDELRRHSVSLRDLRFPRRAATQRAALVE